jgi:hypothetical protein
MSETGENLIGETHRHRWTVPFHGHRMCEDYYCGDVRTLHGVELTPEEEAQIHAELRAEYGA